MLLLPHLKNDETQAKAFLSKHSGGGEAGAPPPLPPALHGGASVDNIADGEASRALADTEAFLPVLAELSSLSNISYAPVGV